VLAEFSSARDAVAWAEAIQQNLLKTPDSPASSSQPLTVRIAIHLDEVFVTQDDIYGPGVNVTARLQEHAEPGGIVLSETVFELVRNDLERPARNLGLLSLKNIPDPVAAYALDPKVRNH
jgi:adenylate cyclase